MGEIEITRGGVIHVDPDELRSMGAAVALIVDELEQLAIRLQTDVASAFSIADDGQRCAIEAEALAARLAGPVARGRVLAQHLEEQATVYEVVEYRAAAAFAALVCDAAAGDAARAGEAGIAARFPDAIVRADQLEREWNDRAMRDMVVPGVGMAAAAGLALAVPPVGVPVAFFTLLRDAGALERAAAIGIARRTGRGIVPHASAPAVRPGAGVAPRRAIALATAAAVAPSSLTDLVERVPSGDGAERVRVDTVTTADGATEYVVYITGTREFLPGSDEPWSIESNVELYTGRGADSLDVVRDAMAQAGATPGDAVTVVGYSHGGMVATSLMQEGTYDVRAAVSVGSPVEYDPGPDVLAVTLRHTDDAVGGLTGGGSPGPIGSPGSFVVERQADPQVALNEYELRGHHYSTYVETARSTDASGDPRIEGLRSFLDRYQGATVSSTTYGADRVPD